MDNKDLFVKELYQGTLDDKIDLGKTIDSYGLSLVHYAILFDKEILISQSLNRKKTTVPNTVPEDDGNKYFDVFFVAAYKGKWDVFDSLYNNSEEYLTLAKSIKTTESTIKKLKSAKTASGIFKSFLKVAESKANANRQLADSYQKKIDEKRNKILNGESMDYAGWMRAQNKLNQFDENYERLDRSIETIDNLNLSIEEKIRELETIKEELCNQLKESRHSFYERYRNRIKYVEKRMNSFVELIFRFYDNPKLRIEFVLSERSKIRINYLGQDYFVDKALYEEILKANAGHKEQKYSQDDESTTQKNTYKETGNKKTDSNNSKKDSGQEKKTAKPLYGDKWFSPEAYRNVVVLKREYRALAKKYHPDMNNGDTSVFVAIHNEMEMILKNIK